MQRATLSVYQQVLFFPQYERDLISNYIICIFIDMVFIDMVYYLTFLICDFFRYATSLERVTYDKSSFAGLGGGTMAMLDDTQKL